MATGTATHTPPTENQFLQPSNVEDIPLLSSKTSVNAGIPLQVGVQQPTVPSTKWPWSTGKPSPAIAAFNQAASSGVASTAAKAVETATDVGSAMTGGIAGALVGLAGAIPTAISNYASAANQTSLQRDQMNREWNAAKAMGLPSPSLMNAVAAGAFTNSRTARPYSVVPGSTIYR